MPCYVAVKTPDAGVVGHEAQHYVVLRGDCDGIAPHRVFDVPLGVILGSGFELARPPADDLEVMS